MIDTAIALAAKNAIADQYHKMTSSQDGPAFRELVASLLSTYVRTAQTSDVFDIIKVLAK